VGARDSFSWTKLTGSPLPGLRLRMYGALPFTNLVWNSVSVMKNKNIVTTQTFEIMFSSFLCVIPSQLFYVGYL